MLPKQVSQSSTQATGQQLAWCSARSHIGRAKRALTLIELLLAVSLSALQPAIADDTPERQGIPSDRQKTEIEQFVEVS